MLPRFRRVLFLNFQRQKDVLLYGPPRKELIFLQHVAERISALFNFLAVQADFAAARLQKARDQREHGGFAASGRPYDRDEFPVVAVERQSVDGRYLVRLGVINQPYILDLEFFHAFFSRKTGGLRQRFASAAY